MPSMRSCYVWLPRLLPLALAVCGTVCVSSSWDTSAHEVCGKVCTDAEGYFPYPVEGQYRVADCNNLSTPSFVIFPLQTRWDVLTHLHKRDQLRNASPELHDKLQASEAKLMFPMTIEDCQCGVLEGERSVWTKWVFVVWGVCFLLLLLGVYVLFWVFEYIILCVIRHTLLASVDAIRVQDACNGRVTIDNRFLQPMLGQHTTEFDWGCNTSKTPKLHQLICQPMDPNLIHFFCEAQHQKIARTARDKYAKVTTAIAELGLIADRWVMVQTIHFVSLFICTCSGFAFGIYQLLQLVQ